MIIEFTVGNFRSFKNKVTLSLQAEQKLLKSNKSRLIPISDGSHLLPSVGIFGANASGKSNINHAIHFMHTLVNGNPEYNYNPVNEYSAVEPFLLDTRSKNKPIFMEIVLWDLETEREYCYGFRLKDKQIIEEWLSIREKANQRFVTKELFRRRTENGNPKFEFNNQTINKRLGKLEQFVKLETSAIFIFNQFADPFSSDFLKLMNKNFITIGDSITDAIVDYSINSFKNNSEIREGVERIIKQADLFIKDLQPVEIRLPLQSPGLAEKRGDDAQRKGRNIPSQVLYQDIQTVHRCYGDKSGKIVNFSLQSHESTGTRKLFCLAVSLVRVLQAGGVAIIDDLDAALHPLLAQALIEQFDNKRTNPKSAQLIYNTHETFLMSDSVNLRRDQIWFTEKNQFEETELICLSEYKTREDYRIDRNYIMGRFGAIPMLQFDQLDNEEE